MSNKSPAADMKHDGKSELKPKLRFPRFRNAPDWDRSPLRTLGKFLRGLTYAARDVARDGLLVLRSSNIQGGRISIKSDVVFVQRECPAELLLREGDVAICMSNGSKSLVGKSAEYRGEHSGDATVGAFCSIFRPLVRFSKLAFTSHQYSQFVALGIAGGNINNLKNSDLEAFEFAVPREAAEQTKVADCLASLDELIAAHAQKLAALETHKKGLMQELFPREGYTLPRLRFPEFKQAPEWKTRRLHEALFLTLRQIKKPLESYTGLGVRSHGKGTFLKDSEDPKKNSMDYLYQVKRDDLVVSITFAWEGAVAIAQPGDDGALVSHRFPTFTFKRNVAIPEFFQHRLSDRLFVYSLGVISPGGAGRNRVLNKNDFLNLSTLLPDTDEQRRIAGVLSSFDRLIATQSQKIQHLKAHRKGLMQQLFPPPQEVE